LQRKLDLGTAGRDIHKPALEVLLGFYQGPAPHHVFPLEFTSSVPEHYIDLQRFGHTDTEIASSLDNTHAIRRHEYYRSAGAWVGRRLKGCHSCIENELAVSVLERYADRLASLNIYRAWSFHPADALRA